MRLKVFIKNLISKKMNKYKIMNSFKSTNNFRQTKMPQKAVKETQNH
jgi:hypothetical protein